MEVTYDILILVSQLLAQLCRFHDVSTMVQTCKLLHVECASLLLTPRRIHLGGNQDLESFCRFMLADRHRRFPLLSQCHCLSIATDDVDEPLSEPVVDLLEKVLPHITVLRSLRFLGFEDIMLSSPRVLSAFAALTGVRHLDLDTSDSTMGGKLTYVKFLRALQSPLKEVKLSLPFTGRKYQHVRYSRALDPIWLFSTFSSSLEWICVIGHITVERCSIVHVYPRLTHLTIPRQSMPFVRSYIKAFPSLRVLEFDYSFFQWGISGMPRHSISTDMLWDRSSEELRRSNREDQAAHGSWMSLEYFMAMTLDAYIASLICRVSTLHLIAWGGTTDAEISAICSTFADARPSRFRFALRPAHVDYLTALFYERAELFSSLLSLELRLDVADMPFNFRMYFDMVGNALQRLPIVFLQVEIKCLTHLSSKLPDDPNYCRSMMTSSPRCYTMKAMAGEDIEGRLRYFVEKIPTLRRVTIAWGQCMLHMPNHVATMDLDNIPHTSKRSGQPTDRYWEDGYQYWGKFFSDNYRSHLSAEQMSELHHNWGTSASRG